jgi:hypothetical protein
MSLFRLSLCKVPLWWMLLAWLSLCWVPVFWVSLCWICWMSWHQLPNYQNKLVWSLQKDHVTCPQIWARQERSSLSYMRKMFYKTDPELKKFGCLTYMKVWHSFASATTLSITTFSITTLSIITFSIMTFSITTHSTEGLFATISITTISIMLPLCWVSLCWVSHFIYYCAECHYADCGYAECRYAECRYAQCHYAECCGPALPFWIFDSGLSCKTFTAVINSVLY